MIAPFLVDFIHFILKIVIWFQEVEAGFAISKWCQILKSGTFWKKYLVPPSLNRSFLEGVPLWFGCTIDFLPYFHSLHSFLGLFLNKPKPISSPLFPFIVLVYWGDSIFSHNCMRVLKVRWKWNQERSKRKVVSFNKIL